MIVACVLLALILSCQAAERRPPPAHSTLPSFSLVVREDRDERHPSTLGGEPTTVRIRMATKLYGRTAVEADEGGSSLFVYADSIRIESTSPYVYRTFMSADTAYYSSRGATGVITADLDSMLQCLFGGPSLRARYSADGELDQVTHVNERCQSGAYEKIDLPVTLGAFLAPSTAPQQVGDHWRERHRVPSFSGLAFHPEVDWWYRVVEGRGNPLVVISVDTTIVDYPLRMRNGEEVTIVSNRMRIAGTLSVGEAATTPRSGQLRIREELVYLRRRGGEGPVRKSCEYTIRLAADR